MKRHHFHRIARSALVIIAGLQALQPSLPTSAQPAGSSIISYTLQSSALGRQMSGMVILPKSYASTRTFPVVYVLHGLGQKPAHIVAALNIQSLADQYEFLTIIPDSGDKCIGSEKNPTETAFCNGGWYLNWYDPSTVRAPINPARFEDYIMRDVIPFAERNYRIRTDRPGRAIMGFSMGGYGALKLGMKYKSFGLLASHSGQLAVCHAPEGEATSLCGPLDSSHRKADDLWELAKGCVGSACGIIYFDTGTSDPNRSLNDDYSRHLSSLNISHIYEPSPGAHNEVYWRTRLHRSIGLFVRSARPLAQPSLRRRGTQLEVT